jgi:membrane protease YdiL (CAAX protease family)
MSKPLFQRDSRFILFDLDERKTSWRGVGLLALVFFGSLLIAAVLTPPAYWLVEWWHNRTGSPDAQWLLDKGVDVYFDRLRMIVIFLGLPWLMSKCHLWSWKGLGLSFGKVDRRNFSLGWFGGMILIVALAIWHHTSTTTQPATVTGSLVFQTIVEALLAGLLLGFLEETIFRGMILRMFYTATRRPWLALAFMSAFYAYTHFKVPMSVWLHVAPGVHWDTGFFVAFWTTFGIAENFDLAQFVVLGLLGMVLGLLTLKSGSLLPAIGLHAGIVSAMFYYRGSGLTDGWATALVLLAILLLLSFTPWGSGQKSAH